MTEKTGRGKPESHRLNCEQTEILRAIVEAACKVLEIHKLDIDKSLGKPKRWTTKAVPSNNCTKESHRHTQESHAYELAAWIGAKDTEEEIQRYKALSGVLWARGSDGNLLVVDREKRHFDGTHAILMGVALFSR